MYGRQRNDEQKDVRGPVEHPKTNCFSISVSMYGYMCRFPLPARSPRRVLHAFILITVMHDVLLFVDHEAQLPHERRGLFVQPLVSFIRQGVRSDIPAYRHR